MTSRPYISLRHLHIFRGGRHILKDFSLDIFQKEIILITGRNGIGKSTLLRAIAGLCPLEAGEILFSEEDAQYPAFLSAQDALKSTLTLEENLSFFAKLGRNNLKEILERLSLSHLASHPVRMLSSGQKRRAAFARICLSPAKLWLLDEPSITMDSENLHLMSEMIEQHRQENGTIILTSHSPLPLHPMREIHLQ